ncbi:MAG: hypothetical protein JWN70_4322 [Planctomycetaceae bacterium]|nr:hypothetical protein [Planctomycetaceae bacterium]
MAISDEQIGANVARARGTLSQKELAQRMRSLGWKWSQATVWSIEKGERPLRLAESEDLAAVLGLGVRGFTSPEPLAQAEAWMGEMHKADVALRKAVADYHDAQLNFAMAGDQVGDGISGHVAMALNSYLSTSPAEVAKEESKRIFAEESAEATAFDRYETDKERAAEVVRREESIANEGPYLTLLNEQWARVEDGLKGNG